MEGRREAGRGVGGGRRLGQDGDAAAAGQDEDKVRLGDPRERGATGHASPAVEAESCVGLRASAEVFTAGSIL